MYRYSSATSHISLLSIYALLEFTVDETATCSEPTRFFRRIAISGCVCLTPMDGGFNTKYALGAKGPDDLSTAVLLDRGSFTVDLCRRFNPRCRALRLCTHRFRWAAAARTYGGVGVRLE